MTSIIERELSKLKGKEILVVMNDGHSYRGALADHDEKWVILRNVSEGTTANVKGWEEPAVTLGFVDKIVTISGVTTRASADQDVRRLKDVLVQLRQVLRIWSLGQDNLEDPKHTRVEARRV